MNESLWQTHRRRHFAAVKADAQYDVVVIGGGITGLSAAYFLTEAGQSVCLVERDRLGGGDTSHTTAHLTAVTDVRLEKLVKSFGQEAANLVWQAGRAAIDAIESIVVEHRIRCEFQRVPGFLHASLVDHPDETKSLKAEARLATQLGINARFVDDVPYVGKPGICFPDQAKIDPLAYLAGLADFLSARGCAIHEQSEVDSFEAKPMAVKVGQHRVACNYLVIATHVPLAGVAGLASAAAFQSKLASFSSYAVSATLPPSKHPEVSLWDTSSPYYYLRLDRGRKHDRVIFGGEDHKTGQDDDTERCYEKLESVLAGIFPEANVEQRWSGQVVETPDGLPYIGETAPRQFAATGFAGNGITFGTLAGMMVRDRLLGQHNPWQELFAAGRKKIRGGAWRYVKENADYPYYYVKDRIGSAEGTSTRAVRRGEGKILKLDGRRVACSRNENGKLNLLQAECTHMGCVVRWNDAEKTWDCPCHGSRFHPDGEVLAGPAESALPAAEPQKPKPAANGRSRKLPRRRSVARGKGR